MKTVETVSFILIKDNKVLVERRRLDRRNDPGAVVVPGGHVEPGETHQEALRREMKEELRLEGSEFRFFDRMLCESTTEYQMNHWYICEDWEGVPNPTEAEEVFYIGGDELHKLSLPYDKAVLTKLFHMAIDRA